jgi:hypothetical protein
MQKIRKEKLGDRKEKIGFRDHFVFQLHLWLSIIQLICKEQDLFGVQYDFV